MPLSTSKLRPGDPAPDIFLPAANGAEVSLRACVLTGPVLVEFIRGTWCPAARKRLDELAETRPAFREERTRILVVACEDAEDLGKRLAARPTPLTVLVDARRIVARAYGVLQRSLFSGWNVARPASFLIDRAGFIRKVFVARHPGEAAPAKELLAELRRLRDESGRIGRSFLPGPVPGPGPESPDRNRSR